jgi:hypothetical protein
MSGVAMFNVVLQISKRITGSTELGLFVNRGVPNNVTTDMDLLLWNFTCRIKKDPASFGRFRTLGSGLLQLRTFPALPIVAQNEIADFMKIYDNAV